MFGKFSSSGFWYRSSFAFLRYEVLYALSFLFASRIGINKMIPNKGKNARKMIDEVIPRLWNIYPAQEYPMMPAPQVAAWNKDIPLPKYS